MVNTAESPQFIAWPEDRPAWLAARQSGFGASEAAAVCGLSRWSTPLEIYSRKLGLIPEVEDNAAMRLGRKLEPIVVSEFEERTGIETSLYPCPMQRHATFPWMFATPDADLVDAALLECKTKNWRSAKELGDEHTDDLPAEIVCQCQQQMAVCGRDRVHVATLVDGRDLLLHVVERNDDLIAGIAAREEIMWQRIQNQDPPPPDFDHKSTHDLIKCMYGNVNDKTITLTDELVQLWLQRQALAAEASAAEKAGELLKDQIRFAIGDAAVAICPGQEFYLERRPVKASVCECGRVTRKESITLSEKKAK